MVVKHEFHGRTVSAIYGHVDPGSLPSVGQTVTDQGQMAVLGEEGEETDGEREYLHFAMYEGSEVRLNGYEANKEDIVRWLNPVEELRK